MGRSKTAKKEIKAKKQARQVKRKKKADLTVDQIMQLTGIKRQMAQYTLQTLQQRTIINENHHPSNIITVPVIPEKKQIKRYTTRQQRRIEDGFEERHGPAFIGGRKGRRKPFKLLKDYLEQDGNTKVILEYYDDIDHWKTKHKIKDDIHSSLETEPTPKKKKKKKDTNSTLTTDSTPKKKKKNNKKKKNTPKSKDETPKKNHNNKEEKNKECNNASPKDKTNTNNNTSQKYKGTKKLKVLGNKNISIETKLPKSGSQDNDSQSQKPWLTKEYLPPENHMFAQVQYSNWFPPLSEENDTTGMDMLDQEIQAFSKFVSLTQEEIQARNYFIQHVRDLALESFGKKKSKKQKQNKHSRLRGDSWGCRHEMNNSSDDDDDDIAVQPFGSFATLSICNFTSDVDLALWGAVKIPQKKVFTIDSDIEDDDEDDQKGKSGVKMLSQSSLRRTMDAFRNNVNQKSTSSKTNETDKENKLSRWRDALSSVDILPKNNTEQMKKEEIILLSDHDDDVNEVSVLKKDDKDKAGDGFYSDMLKCCNKKEEDPKKDNNCEVSNESFVIDRTGAPIDSSNSEGDSVVKTECTNKENCEVDCLFVVDKKGESIPNDTEVDNQKLAPAKIENSEITNNLFVVDREGKPVESFGDDVKKEDPCTTTEGDSDNIFVLDHDGVSSNKEDEKSTSYSTKEKFDDKLLATNDLKNEDKVTTDGMKSSDTLSTNVQKIVQQQKFNSSDDSEIHLKDEKSNDASSNALNLECTGNIVGKVSKINTTDKCRESGIQYSEESDNSSIIESISGSDDDDSADKMESYPNSKILGQKETPFTKMTVTDKSENEIPDETDLEEIIEISSSSCSDLDLNNNLNKNDKKQNLHNGNENGHLEVSGIKITRERTKEVRSLPGPLRKKASFGPTGQTRTLVIAALRTLSRKLWKSDIVQSVELRRHARVPIIALNTKLGFEGDIALGGHNGTDTSHYASGQASRFQR